MKNKGVQIVNISLRVALVMAFLLICFVVIVVRAFSVQIQGAEFYQDQGEKRHVREVDILVSRGSIYDRNGEPLALSTAMQSVGIEPRKLVGQFSKLEQLAQLLDLDANELKNIVSSRGNIGFLFIKRHITPALADSVKGLNVDGVGFRTEFKRYYPAGEILAQVVGYTDVDDKGQEGLERTYDNWLTGTSGRKTVVKDLLGQVVADIDVDEIIAAQPGKDLHLSIDRRLQYAAYLALKKAVYTHSASSGSAVILDVETGEILAMVNQPSFNPNGNREINDGLRNRTLTDIFEPGSVMKTFAGIAALERDRYQP
ncbi:MAG: penicillin-binding protein 2, partial [Proteobacteria bacterium]|nr:penicillin-binding protein 2 [Pseudomonadota bacterium]